MPNLSTSLQLLIEIDTMLTGCDNPIAKGFRVNFQNIETPSEKIINELKEMAEDNPDMITKLLGENLTSKLLKY